MALHTAGIPLRSRLLDDAVMIAGAVVMLAAFAAVVGGDGLDPRWLLVVPVIAVMAFFPLVLTRASGGIEVGFESAVLVFLAAQQTVTRALLLWCFGIFLSQLASRKRPQAKVFNMGLGNVSGALALFTMRSFGELGTTSVAELLSVALGCVVYFLSDYLLSGVSIALEERGRVLEELRQPSAASALVVFVAIDSLGYLAALVSRRLPWWAMLLLGVPLITILVAARALTRGNEHRRRLAALFQAAADAQTLQTVPAVREAVTHHAREVVKTTVELRPTPPGPGELGAQTRGPGSDDLWLVAPARLRARSTLDADRQALEALVTVTEEAFARIGLVGKMGHLARHDALTGLANRVLFLDRVEHAVALGRRSGRHLAVLFIDLDGFKAINDRFGHDAGDAMLVNVAGRIVDCVREVDTVARLGGDEFAVLVEEVPSMAHVEHVCRRLLAAFLPDIEVAGHQVAARASIGVAFSTEEDDGGELLRNADMAMYRAKTLGKGRFAVYEPALREESVRRTEIVEALRHDMVDDCLIVYYQPVVDLTTNRIDAFEALVRWRRDGVIVLPDVFIALAEENGIVGDIGERVLAQVVADAPLLMRAAGRPLSLGVNVSASQLEPRFVEIVARATEKLGPNQLMLEMTENVLIGDDEQTSAVLHDLVTAGATLAIDDFGVGFSSIGYLQHLPVQVLKIDRSFTADIDSDERALALVEAMTLMATALGLRVVAEGIERPAQLDRLRSVGCAIGQGFLLGRPVGLEQTCALLRTGLEAPARAPSVEIQV